jgi:hypothetical protein
MRQRPGSRRACLGRRGVFRIRKSRTRRRCNRGRASLPARDWESEQSPTGLKAHVPMYLPGSDDCLDACLEFYDADLSSLIKRHDGNAQGVGQTCQAVRLVLVVERVEDLDCKQKAIRKERWSKLDMLASHWSPRYVVHVVGGGSGRRRRVLSGTLLRGSTRGSRHGCLGVD